MYEPTPDKVRCVHVCALPNLTTLSHTVIVENFVVWKFSWLPPSTKIMPTKIYVQRIQ